jgi:hypothetical protein
MAITISKNTGLTVYLFIIHAVFKYLRPKFCGHEDQDTGFVAGRVGLIDNGSEHATS